MSYDRTDPRRIAMLVVLIGGAVAWAWFGSQDGTDDLLRFVAGAGAGLGATLEIFLAGALAGLFAGVGVLYPLEQR